MKTVLAITFLFLLCCFANVRETKEEDKAVLMNSYKLSLMWPPQYCAKLASDPKKQPQCERGYPNSFMIHGLWPTDANGRSLDANVPPPCQPHGKKVYDGPLREKIREKLEGDVKMYWKDLAVLNNPYSFWGAEWKKHGRCSSFPDDPAAYFKFAADQAKKHNILKMLEKEGIRPSKTLKYPAPQFGKILSNANVQIEIHCDGYPIEIAELRVCMDPKGKLINCTQPYSRCPGEGSAQILFREYPKD